MFKHPNAGRIASIGRTPASSQGRKPLPHHGRRAIPQLGGLGRLWGRHISKLRPQKDYFQQDLIKSTICMTIPGICVLSPRHDPWLSAPPKRLPTPAAKAGNKIDPRKFGDRWSKITPFSGIQDRGNHSFGHALVFTLNFLGTPMLTHAVISGGMQRRIYDDIRWYKMYHKSCALNGLGWYWIDW
jgi:hypothetical protein